MSGTDETQYVDPDTWWDRLYSPGADSAVGERPTPATAADDHDQAEAAAPVDLTKAEPGEPADGEPQADGPSGWWRSSRPPVEPEADDDDDEDAGPPFDLRALADQLTGVLSETPQEREQRRYAEAEARYADAGESRVERSQRHREERRQRERWSSVLPLVPHSERVSRFRRWVVLTALSASAGYACDLVQIAARLPLTEGAVALGAGWWFDLWMRRWGRTRVSQVRGAFPLALLLVVRIPVASALVAVLGLAPLLALTNHH